MHLASSQPETNPEPDPPVVALFGDRRERSQVRVLEEMPELAADLRPAEAAAASVRCVAGRLVINEGPWEPPSDADRCSSCLGLLVLSGLVVRAVSVNGMRAQEILGPGDLLRPWDDDSLIASVPATTTWHVLDAGTVALLDGRFATAARPWPSIARALLRGVVQRGYSRSVLLAIAQARRADVRLLLLFWHLADRWGRVGPNGIAIPLRLTHERLAELVCLRRPTVSMALSSLRARGLVLRATDGTWLLRGDPPSADQVAAGT